MKIAKHFPLPLFIKTVVFLCCTACVAVLLTVTAGFKFGLILAALTVIILGLAFSFLISREFSKFKTDIAFSAYTGNPFIPSFKKSILPESLKNKIHELITEKNHADKQIIELEKTLQHIKRQLESTKEYQAANIDHFQNSALASFLYSRNGTIMDVNFKACSMLNYTREELVHSSFWALHDPAELNRPHHMHDHYKTSSDISYESVFIRKNGYSFPVELHTSVIDADKMLIQCLAFDISERKSIQTSLELSEARYRQFIESASDFMFITDENGKIIYANPSMCNGLNKKISELVNTDLFELFGTISDESFRIACHKLIGNNDEPVQCNLLTNQSGTITGELMGTVLLDSNDDFKGFSGVFRDITQRKKAEESQRLAQMGRLAADVAHQIKNQLSVIFSLAELSLLDDTPPDELHENLTDILAESGRINDVVRRLLMFSRPSTGQKETVQIESICSFVLKLLEKPFYQANIKITAQYEKNMLPFMADVVQIREVLVNLLQNAIEAMGQNGSIAVSAYMQNSSVILDISDTGPGIPKEHLNKIFEPFFTTKPTGTGLGLSACYGILKAHGGDLQFFSEPAAGTTARLILPAAMPG